MKMKNNFELSMVFVKCPALHLIPASAYTAGWARNSTTSVQTVRPSNPETRHSDRKAFESTHERWILQERSGNMYENKRRIQNYEW